MGTVTGLYHPQTQILTTFQFTDTAQMPIAPSTIRTPWSFSSDSESIFVTKKLRVRDIKATGDYLIDDSLNRLYFYHGGGSTAAAGTDSTGVVANLYHYQSTNDDNISSEFACVVGPIHPGDYLKPTAKSNYQPVEKANGHFALSTAMGGSYDQTDLQAVLDELETAVEEEALIIGQVLEIETYPKDGLELVRTYGSTLPNSLYLDKMPGDATEGLPDKLTYAGGANKVVRVNIIRK